MDSKKKKSGTTDLFFWLKKKKNYAFAVSLWVHVTHLINGPPPCSCVTSRDSGNLVAHNNWRENGLPSPPNFWILLQNYLCAYLGSDWGWVWARTLNFLGPGTLGPRVRSGFGPISSFSILFKYGSSWLRPKPNLWKVYKLGPSYWLWFVANIQPNCSLLPKIQSRP